MHQIDISTSFQDVLFTYKIDKQNIQNQYSR